MQKDIQNFIHLRPEEKFISIRERLKCDSSFAISCLLDSPIKEDSNILLILTHNTLGHFHNLGRIVGYDIVNLMKTGRCKTVELLKELNKIDTTLDDFIKKIFKNIFDTIDELLKDDKKLVIIFEDVSHFLDLGMDMKELFMYLNAFKRLTMEKNVYFYISCRSVIGLDDDDYVYNALYYLSDVVVHVSGLKTGISRNVTGSIEFVRPDSWTMKIQKEFYHYSLDERKIDIFLPGKSM